MGWKLKSSWYRPPSLSWPHRSQHELEADYCQWLSKARGWDMEATRKYAFGMLPGRILSATFAKEDSVAPAAVKRKAKAAKMPDRVRALAAVLVDEFSQAKIDARAVAQAIIGLREALKEAA